MDSISEKSGGDENQVRLKRRLGLHHGVAVIVGLVVGSGIYVAPKGIMIGTGSAGLALILWVVCGIGATLGALCFAELGTTFPVSGEKYVYLRELYGDFPSFLYLWMYMVMFRPGANAIKALTFGYYVVQPFYQGENCAVDQRAVTLLAVCLPCESTNVY